MMNVSLKNSANKLLTWVIYWIISFPQWAAVWKLTQHYYALTYRADVCRVWFAVTLVGRNIQVATVTIDCIHLQQDIWELAWGKFMDKEYDFNKKIFLALLCQDFNR